MLLFSAACIPASPPPNVSATPGAAAIITQSSYRNDLFSIEYPAGWRVITSPAGSPPSVTLVAPGDCGLVVVSSVTLDSVPTSPSCDATDFTTDQRTIPLGETTVTIAGSAPAADWQSFQPEMERIADSLQPASPD